MTSRHDDDSNLINAYISGGASLFGLLSATVTGSLDLKDIDKAILRVNKVRICHVLTQEKDDSAKFVLSYRAKTREEMLTSELLSNINTTTCQEVANTGLNLTHFVIGVSYGGSCDITFKQVVRYFSVLFLFCHIQKIHDLEEFYFKRFQLTATIKVLFFSKTFNLLDISETDEYKQLTQELEMKVSDVFQLFILPSLCVSG